MKIKLMVCGTILILFTSSLFSQEIKNFTVTEGDLVWQKVYDIDITQVELNKFLTLGGYFEKIESEDGVISGNLRPFELDLLGAGENKNTVPMYLYLYDIICFASVEFKPGKYRVTVSHIKLVQKRDDPTGKKGDVENLENFAVSNNGTFKANFVKKPSLVYDFNFNKIFEYKEAKADGNW